MSRQKANTDKRAQAAENRKLAFEYRKAGWTYAQIGERLGVSETSVYKYVAGTLKALAAETRESAEEVRDMELQRLDMLLKGLEPMAAIGNVGAVTAYLKVMERRAKLLGLDAPAKSEIKLDDWRTDAIAAIREGRVGYDDLVDLFDAETATALLSDAKRE